MPPQSCLTSSTVYFARLRSRVGLVSTCFDTFSSIVLSHANFDRSRCLPKNGPSTDLLWDLAGNPEITVHAFQRIQYQSERIPSFQSACQGPIGEHVFVLISGRRKWACLRGILSVVRKTNRRVLSVIGDVSDHLSEIGSGLCLFRHRWGFGLRISPTC